MTKQPDRQVFIKEEHGQSRGRPIWRFPSSLISHQTESMPLIGQSQTLKPLQQVKRMTGVNRHFYNFIPGFTNGERRNNIKKERVHLVTV